MPDVHVVPHGDDAWALQDMDEILVDDAGRRLIFDRREDAVVSGRELAREEGVRLILHDADGDVRTEDLPATGSDSAAY